MLSVVLSGSIRCALLSGLIKKPDGQAKIRWGLDRTRGKRFYYGVTTSFIIINGDHAHHVVVRWAVGPSQDWSDSLAVDKSGVAFDGQIPPNTGQVR